MKSNKQALFFNRICSHLNSTLIGCLVVFLSTNGSAQFDPPQPTFYNFSTAEGLPSSETYFVYQDKKGFIWICTDRGVVRYNGYSMQVLTEKEGLPDNVVFKVYEDYKGRIWFITYNGLLSYWDGNKIIPYKYNNQVKKYLGGDITTFKSFSIDKNDNILYSAQYKGLVSISGQGEMKITRYKPKEGVYFYNSGYDWLLVLSLMTELDKPMPIYTIINNKQTKITEIKHSNSVGAYTAKGKGFFLFNDLIINSDKPLSPYKVLNTIGLSINQQNIWYCTTSGAFSQPISDFGSNQHSPNYLSGYTITSVCQDQEGGYWFSTIEKGVFYTRNLNVTTFKVSNNENFNVITGVSLAKNQVFFANKFGIHQMTKIPYLSSVIYNNNPRIDVHNDQITESINTLIKRHIYNKSGSGQHGYYDVFFKNNYTFFTSNDVVQLKPNGQFEQLYSFVDDQSATSQHFLHAIMQDQKNRIIVGNNNGLFEVKNHRLYTNQFNDSRFKHRVSDLDFHPILKGIAATRGIGVYFFDNFKITHHLTTKDGLLDDQINSLFIDENGAIWVCSNKGLNRIDTDQAGRIIIQRMTMMNGLPSNEVNRVFAKNGEVWVATKNGLAHISSLHNWSQKHIHNQLKIDNLTTEDSIIRNFRNELVFNSTVNNIKIALASSNFRTGKDKKIRYRYSSSDAWILSNEGELSLTKPAAGSYILEISYLNEAGHWSKPQVMCRFYIDNPFYLKWYAVLVYIALGISGIVLFFKRRIRQIKLKNKQQKNIQQLEQKALQAQMNPHFIFNSLNSIQSFLIYEENEKAERFLLKFAQLIRQTLNNSRVSYITISSEIETLQKYLELEQMRFKDKFKFSIINELEPQELQYGIPPMLLQPFVENAVLHGFKTIQHGGEITLQFVSIKNNRLKCIVDDNGIGRSVAEQFIDKERVSFGTKITEQRLAAFRQKYNDEFRIQIIDKKEENRPTGTLVIIEIPVVLPNEVSSEN